MRFIYFSLLLLVISCNANRQRSSPLQLSLQRSALLDSLSSGSGMVFTKQGVFVVSDNMNGFFKLDTASLRYDFVAFDTLAAHIQGKDTKEDFENATTFEFDSKDHIIAFGSGSVADTREKILLIPINEPGNFSIKPAKAFYDSLKARLGISTAQLNLEACFTGQDSIYLLNRGTNQSIAISMNDMEKAISSSFTAIPAMTVRSYRLPELEGFNAAFSGACFYKDDLFIFSATVEKTKNWVDDGEVAGSFIGLGKTDGTILKVLPLKNKNNQMIKEKIESLELLKPADGGNTLYAISDNDNGRSTWFVIGISGLDR